MFAAEHGDGQFHRLIHKAAAYLFRMRPKLVSRCFYFYPKKNSMSPETTSAAPVESTAAPAAAPASSTPAPGAAAETASSAAENVHTQTQDTSASSEPADIHEFLKTGFLQLNDSKPAEVTDIVNETPVEQTDVPAETPAETAPAEATTEAAQPAEKPLLTQKPVILTEDEIKTQFARVPKAAQSTILEYANLARSGQELIDKIGGEHFVEPVAKIAESIRNGDNMGVFSGYLEAGTVDGFADLINDTLDLAFVQIAQGEPTNDGEKWLKERTQTMLDSVLQTRFGENASLQRIEQLLKYDRDGYLNTDDVSKYYEEADAHENPVISSLKEENAKLKAQIGEKETIASEQKREQEKLAAERFATSTNETLDKVLSSMVYETSALNPVTTDSTAFKAGKEAAKSLLNSHAQTILKNNPQYAELQKSYLRGESSTAIYKSKLTGLMETAMLEAKEMASKFEAVFAEVANNSRDVKLLNSQETQEQPVTETPSIAKTSEVKALSSDDFHSWLSKQFSDLGQ